ncbi:hypothetical protein [Pseudonocardia broussonetiae]|uniref:Uncharacterized protein n=1 Tax=Pseudonocardia broussonetiae TaxID=2736640 RepID=A0A6M6JJI3_9PSEU|nr:hypothetical protein [Pseudonocardia broussonetiae]QJY47576.1 hypothetical protein HOP40_18630 [Pseudonocardia broussonetiae]
MTLRRLLVTSATACVLLAGCGSPTPAATPDPVPPPSGVPAVTEPAVAPAVAAPWPARSAAESVGLQESVDDGAQPWLLDPAELARSYVAAAYGWDDATVVAAGGGTAGADTVDVTGPDGTRRVLTVAQPGRTGEGGIWVVTADDPA